MKDFFVKYKVPIIIVSAVVLLVAIWTPIIVMLTKNDSDNTVTSSSVSTNANISSAESDVTESILTSSNVSKNESSKVSHINDESSVLSNKISNLESSVPGMNSINASAIEPTEEVVKKRIICWGDSFTRGMHMSKGEKYPDYLQELVGDKFEVLNGGSSGEKSHTIAARQGAFKVYTGIDIVFSPKSKSVDIGTELNCGLVLEDGTPLDINPYGEAFNYQMKADILTINGTKYTFSVSNQVFKINRKYSEEGVTIPKGTEVILSSSESQKGSYCEIFYVGANDKLQNTEQDIQKLIDTYKAMIKQHGNDCYLVVMPHYTSDFDNALRNAFGNKAVNIREVMCDYGMSSVGLKPTDDDYKRMLKGEVPDSLRLNNNPIESHLNKYGYEIIANALYERGKELNYWN